MKDVIEYRDEIERQDEKSSRAMNSFKGYRTCRPEEPCGRKEQESLEKGFDVLLSGANEDRIKNQHRRREILRAASNKLKHEMRSREGSRGRKNWKKVPEIKIKASDGSKVHVPNPGAEVESVVMATESIAAVTSPTFTEQSDYTISSASMDDKALENYQEMKHVSLNGKLGQWDIVEDTNYNTVWKEENKVIVLCSDMDLQSAFHGSWNHSATCQEGRSTSSEHSASMTWPTIDEAHYDTREEFDIVYDVFYQEEPFEAYEAFIVTEDLQSAVKEELDENGDMQDESLSRSATPPLERVDSPEFSSRVNLKALPSMSTRNSNEEFLSFSRRDLSVLRQSLRELQVGMFQDNIVSLHGGTSEEIQEDVFPARELIEEKEELVSKSMTARSSICQEMLTQQERKVRPLSAARVLMPLSNSVMLGPQIQADDYRERCPQLNTVAELPRAELNGAEVRAKDIGEIIFQRENIMLNGHADIDAFRRADLESTGSSLTSSCATPRTGISANDQDDTTCKRTVPSRPKPQEATEGTILERLSAKVQMLDVTQQKYLLQVLNKLERAQLSGGLNLPSMFASLERPWMGLPLTSPEVEGAPKTHLIVLRILSTWGDTKCVGLVEVELFDVEDTKLELKASCLSLQGCLSTDPVSTETICRLINGIANTTSEKNMWLCRLPPAGDAPLEIHIQVHTMDRVPGYMRVWNYNRSIGDAMKGVKEMQVYVDGELIWQGMISKGCGNQVFDYSTRIPLLEDTPLSTTTSTTHVHSNHTIEKTNFIPSAADVGHEIAGPVVAAGILFSVGTSFTFSPVQDLSTPSSCGTLTSTSSPRDEQSLSTAKSDTIVHSSKTLLASEVDFVKVDVLNDESKGLDGVCSPSDSGHAEVFLSQSFGEGCEIHRATESLPIWLSEHQKVATLKLDSDRPQSSWAEGELYKDWSYHGPTVGRRHPMMKNMDHVEAQFGGDGWFCHDVLQPGESYEEIPCESNFPMAGRQNLKSSSGSKCNFIEITGEEKSEYCEIDAPRKQRLMHSAFSGLRKVVIRLRLGLRLTSRDEAPPAEVIAETDDMFSHDNISVLPQSSVGKVNFLLGVGSHRLPSCGQQAEYKPDSMYGDPDFVSSRIFESATDCEVRDSWDSLVKFRAAQMRDQHFCSPDVLCQQFDKPAQSTCFYYPDSNNPDFAPVSPEPSANDMIRHTKQQLETLRSSLCEAAIPCYHSGVPNGHFESWFLPDAGPEFKMNQEPSEFEVLEDQSDEFTIPSLPCGRELVVNILSTWGDPHYVGLVGIEMFDESGELIQIQDPSRQIQADPPDINILPGYNNDPRTVDKLVDNVNLTCDDYHVWLTPFTLGNPHLIKITFNSVVRLGMLRFWNYNKSRIHSFRGARIVEVALDQKLIFVGELRKASGLLADAAQHAEAILFTNKEVVMEAIERYDLRYHRETEPVLAEESALKPLQRPDTAGSNTTALSPKLSLEKINLSSRSQESGDRPVTHAIKSRSRMRRIPLTPERSEHHNKEGRIGEMTRYQERSPVGQILLLKLLKTWGDPHYAGLTSIEVLAPDGVPYSIPKEALSARPRDLNDIPGCRGDHRTLDKLVDGCCNTTDDHHMWLIPFEGAKSKHWLRIDLGMPLPVAAIKIWNYNKNLDDTCRGVKWLQVFLDDLDVSPPGGHLVRKATGTDKFDFGHLLSLSRAKHSKRDLSQLDKINCRERAKQRRSHVEFIRQEYETPILPCGFIFKLALLSTWGDQHYMGLNGVQLYDEAGHLLSIFRYNVHASPSSINELEGVDDIRTLEKLLDGENNTWDDQHMWLTLYDPGKINYLYFVFDQPCMLSVVRIWNYSKTPSRGVYEFELHVDDLLVYKGYLRQAPHFTSVSNGPLDFSQALIFTNEEGVLREHQDLIYFRGDIEHTDVVLINEKHVESFAKPSTYSTLESRQRPATGLSGLRRPY